MRLIDADAMKEWLDEYLSVFKKYDKGTIKGFVDHAPSIDIVRCKECKWLTKDQYDEPYCGFHSIGIYADDYCSYGERKSDE